ncbi:MAG: circadian clock KaiB family protein [Pyrinomonadaceae bacterium]
MSLSDQGDKQLGANDSIYVLKLYVAGTTPSSARAVVNIRKICETHLEGRYELEVIDIISRPEMAKKADLIGAPTLVRHQPLPLRRFLGDMSMTDRLLSRLEID